MVTFSKKVDRRSRKAMTDFLRKHYRYHTMNSWNQSTSYAHNMKIYNLGLEQRITEKLYDLLESDEFHWQLSSIIREFDEAHNYEWQAGFNGRSDGYLVLYQGETKPSGYKSYCPACGQKNYKSVKESGSVCGKCGQAGRRDFPQTHMSISSFPGRSTDQYEDFEDWDMSSLRERVDLVCEFDAMADAIAAEAVYMAENFSIEEETYFVAKTRKVLVEAVA